MSLKAGRLSVKGDRVGFTEKPMTKDCPKCPNAETSLEFCPLHGRGPCLKVTTNAANGRAAMADALLVGIGLTMWLGPLGAAVCGAVLLAASRTR